ncbi:reverse transcriptase [Purpureocillium lavendulum]|uniref:Reverse transcriptase n=1 Tax=Purpureocillium lavendulum TaxID=1247861 RepID=A0AB34FFD5_9HYPO|nr:reverse transcriptase [Purpureocillium lavendulum]
MDLTPTGRRVVKRKIDDSGNESSRHGRYATRTTAKATPAKVNDCATDARNGSSDSGEDLAALQHVSELLGDCRAEFAGFKQMIRGQSELIRTQQETIQDLKEAAEEQRSLIRDLKVALEDTKQHMGLELKRLSDKLEAITARPSVTPPRSFAEVAGSQRPSQPTTVTPSKTAAAPLAGSLYCTIDTSRVEEANRDRVQVGEVRQAIEVEMRAKDGRAAWRCAAVVRDARAAERIKVICRDENELEQVKQAAQKAAVVGARVMRDQLYPVKVDNANRSRVLDAEGNVLPGAAEALGAENNVNIAKVSWLSNKESGKAYGSMVVYVTKESDARRLVDGHYFDLAGESATTNVFERRTGPVQCYNCQAIGHKSFQCKNAQVCGSLMNDDTLKDYGVLAVSEPYARLADNKVVTSPMWHNNWTKMIPTKRHNALWPIRSMLWVRSDIEAEQLPVASADLTAAVLRLPERDVLVVSVYVQGKDAEMLVSAMEMLHGLIRSFRDGTGRRTDVVLVGDFNRHDLLWTGDDVSVMRQGEAEPIVDLMNEHGLCSLLPRGTRTWQGQDKESTIDLVLTTSELADEMVACVPHPTDHGSDHRAIRTTFDVALPERVATPRLLFKNAPWNLIRARVDEGLQPLPKAVDVQTQADQLMRVVSEAIHDLTPQAQPSPYAKRWWSGDLTRLRRAHTFWRNQARAQRRASLPCSDLERRAKEAAKEYHDAIRKQRRAHWDDFLAEDANIWKAARYLEPGKDAMTDRVPPLKKADGTRTRNRPEQAEQLLDTFFPPLPARIEEEGLRPQRRAVAMPALTLEEVEVKVMAAKPWKAAGTDGLPAMVWRQLWPVVKHRVLALFRASLREGVVPHQWRTAKIIPLKKPEKGDYTEAKAWRPISLLSTLGKILEAVIAERISYMVEAYGLLPANHFGARKRRSAEQALLLLQEQIYKAWRARKVLSLVSFDVKGAYNGVCKERLLQRMRARGLPDKLVRWVDAFCSSRTASIVVNGYTSAVRELPQAGLPQGSPLSPVLFLFFNADLVQRRIKAAGGSIAFIDDYSAWVTGPTAEANGAGIQAIIDDAIDWEKRSGATFEADKTTVIHFTRAPARKSDIPFWINGTKVKPKASAKILGLIMDDGLRYQKHMARAAEKGLTAAMSLKRLKMLSPKVARQLFMATVAPAMDYASTVWMHARRAKETGWLNKAQRIGAQAVIGAFRTVATAVAEAEASIPTIEERHRQAATRLCVDLRTLPQTHPLAALRNKASRRYLSPMQGIASVVAKASTERMEVIGAFALRPWAKRIPVSAEMDLAGTVQPPNPQGIIITTASSQKDGRRATEQECVVETPPYQASSTTLRLALARERPREQLPDSVGKYLKRIDKALPGRHTRALYEALKRRESDVLAQLRTGMMRLNSYLRKIGAAESDMCDCGQAPETTEHFLFRCKKWSGQREILFTCSRTKIGNLSFFLGGKATSDDDKWEPDMRAVPIMEARTDIEAKSAAPQHEHERGSSTSNTEIDHSDQDQQPPRHADEEKAPTPDPKPAGLGPPPDGGLQAWLVVVGGFCTVFASFGWINCIGIFQDYYQHNQLASYSPSSVAWISSTESFMLFFWGPLAGKLTDEFGPRIPILIGSVLHVFGLMMTSLSTEYYQIFLSQSICTIAALGTWFLRHRALAFGIITAGSSVGGVVLPIMVERLVTRVGFGWAMRATAFLFLGLLVVGNLTVSSRLPPSRRPFRAADFIAPFAEPAFLLLTVSAFVIYLGAFLPFNFIIVQAKAQGMGEALAGYLVPIVNAASTFGRIVPAHFGDRYGVFNVMILLTLLCGASILGVWLPAVLRHSDGALIAFAALYGFASGCTLSIVPAMVASMTPDPSRLGTRNGSLYACAAIGVLVGSPVGGALVDARGGAFDGLVGFCGACLFVGAGVAVMSRHALVGFAVMRKV